MSVRIHIRVFALSGLVLQEWHMKGTHTISQLHTKARDKLRMKHSREFSLVTRENVALYNQSLEQLWELNAVKDGCLELQLVLRSRECGFCGRHHVSMPKCSKCGRIRYCNVDCQLGDWTRHKAECQNTLNRPEAE